MQAVLPADVRAFLESEPLVAKLACNRKSGGPWIQPVWFVLEGDEPAMAITAQSVSGRVLQRDPRMALCIDDIRPPYAFVTIEGRASVSQDERAGIELTRRLVDRYRPDQPDPAAYRSELYPQPPLVCRLQVEKVHFMASGA